MLVFTVPYTAFIHGVVQYEGILTSNRKIAERFRGRDVVVLFNGPYVKSYYPEVLRYLYGVDALPMSTDAGQEQVFNSLVGKLRSQGKTVFLASSAEQLPSATAGQRMEPVGSDYIVFNVFRQIYGARPTKITPFGFNLNYFKV